MSPLAQVLRWVASRLRLSLLRPSLLGPLLLCPLLGWLAMAAPVVLGAEEPAAALDASTVAEIERLRSEISALLASVSPALRAEVLAALIAAAQETQPMAESAATERSVSEPSVSEPLPASAADVSPPPPPTFKRRVTCNALDAFDENGDGKVTAQDRYWRHLHLWVDGNRDGQAQEKEILSAYGAGVREISTRLDVFFRKKGSLGEIRIDGNLRFDLGGDGFGDGRRPDDGVLMVDADALGRGDGPEIVDGQGDIVSGMAIFAAGWRFRPADGPEWAVVCPGLEADR